MPNKEDVALMAHLMRRAGFGATRDELDRYVAMGYEATVDELIDPPDEVPSGKTALLLRYLPGALLPGGTPTPGQFNWMYHMITTQRPLVEKTALFWHHVFATAPTESERQSLVGLSENITPHLPRPRAHGPEPGPGPRRATTAAATTH